MGSDIGVMLRCTGKVEVGRYGRLAVRRHPGVFDPIDVYAQGSSPSHPDDMMPLTVNNCDVTLRIELVGNLVINENLNSWVALHIHLS
ncbi:hypothetical protein ES703_82602 [subsurface metagenome]